MTETRSILEAIIRLKHLRRGCADKDARRILSHAEDYLRHRWRMMHLGVSAETLRRMP